MPQPNFIDFALLLTLIANVGLPRRKYLMARKEVGHLLGRPLAESVGRDEFRAGRRSAVGFLISVGKAWKIQVQRIFDDAEIRIFCPLLSRTV